MTMSGVALLMVSRVPTVSLKRIRIPHDLVVPTLLAVGVLTAFFTTAPWPTLTLIGIIYVGSIPVTVIAYYRLRRAGEPGRGGGTAAPALASPEAAADRAVESSARADELPR